ncbi:hypothetical protein V6N11_044113 [Hibiscus sabdariffa]|uniref:Reverse transcriptase zinc-binding domain-containing protein n=1 Tax=Hibiscus sabdariffa TaxID=183260 RepID=A0ABR2RES0_9ROSI
MFLWLVCHERVLTNVEKRRRRLTQVSSCAICGDGREGLDHFLRFCPPTLWRWNQLIRSDASNEFNTLPIKEWILANFLTPTRFVYNFSEWPTMFPYILWNLWKRGNERVFQGNFGQRDDILALSLSMANMGQRVAGSIGTEATIWCQVE